MLYQPNGFDLLACHEAGHAIVAIEYGLEISTLGMEPFPHCNARMGKVSKEQCGILYMAGMAATELMYSVKMPTQNDTIMASALGDISYFQSEAEKVIARRYGEFCLIEQMVSGYHNESAIRPGHPQYEVIREIVDKAAVTPLKRKLILAMGWVQVTFPRLVGAITGLERRLRGM